MTIKNDQIREAIREHLEVLSQTEKRVAEFTLKNFRDCGMLSIGQLAAECGVSTATVNRYARALGYSGYQEYRSVLCGELSSKSSLRLLQESIRSGNSQDLLELSLLEDADQIRRLRDSLTPASFEGAVAALLKARRIFLLGQGSSQYFAGYLAFNFQGLGMDVTALASASGVEGIARAALQMSDEDVLVCIAFPRFSALTSEVAESACSAGCKIIAITSSLSSSLARVSDWVLCAPSRRDLHSGSGVSAVSVCEALITALTSQAPNAESAARRLSPLIDHHLAE